jgi:ketosteroid isomerase-like protein
MKKIVYIGLIIAITAFAAFAQKPAPKPTPTKKPAAGGGTMDATKPVKDVFDRLVEGIKQNDVNKVMSTYEKSDRILFFNNNGTATIGWDNMKSNREQLYAKTKNVTLDITGLRIEMLGKTAAYATCKWKQSQEFDGKLENASGRMTLVFKLIGKEWKIVHLHTSPDNPAATRPVLPSERENPTDQ